MKYLDKLYKMHDISWFTPVELFKVHHSFSSIISTRKLWQLMVVLSYRPLFISLSAMVCLCNSRSNYAYS